MNNKTCSHRNCEDDTGRYCRSAACANFNCHTQETTREDGPANRDVSSNLPQNSLSERFAAKFPHPYKGEIYANGGGNFSPCGEDLLAFIEEETARAYRDGQENEREFPRDGGYEKGRKEALAAVRKVVEPMLFKETGKGDAAWGFNNGLQAVLSALETL